MKWRALLMPCIAAFPLTAQVRIATTIDSGMVVRMHTEGAPVTRGRLIAPVGPSSTAIRFCRYPAPKCHAHSASEAFGEVDVKALTHLDVQRGSKWAMGAVIGSTIGAALGSIAAGFAAQCDHSACSRNTVIPFLKPTVILGLIGAMMGSGSNDWKAVF